MATIHCIPAPRLSDAAFTSGSTHYCEFDLSHFMVSMILVADHKLEYRSDVER
jgi:hypothetical protein